MGGVPTRTFEYRTARLPRPMGVQPRPRPFHSSHVMRNLTAIRGTRRTRQLARGIFTGAVIASLVSGGLIGFSVWSTFNSDATAVGLMNVNAVSVAEFAPAPRVEAAADDALDASGAAAEASGRIPPTVRVQPARDPARGAAGLTELDAQSAATTGGIAGASAGMDVPMFNGRPIERVRVLRMKVTAYSPDERSCGIFADGVTASGYSVWTNAGRLVAADTDLLPFGTILRVPGYDAGRAVPVLDRGAAIRGHRLDLLFPSHEAALEWGVQELEVEVWDYVEG